MNLLRTNLPVPAAPTTPARESAEAYCRREGLDALIARNDDADALPPELDDLVRLHRLVRTRRAAVVIEFGAGWSTLVIADALARNAAEFGGTDPGAVPVVDHQLHTVETGSRWIKLAASRLPEALRDLVTFHQSPALAGTFQGQLCHTYKLLPDVVPEVVYLDGPDPAAVEGSVNGVGFAAPGRTPMAADLLLLEPLLLPGAMILVDGRTANARFLANNFRRDWDVYEDPEGRFTTFELVEPPLGPRKRARRAFCEGDAP